MRHHLEVKPSRVTRRLNGDVELPPTQAKIIKRLLGKSAK